MFSVASTSPAPTHLPLTTEADLMPKSKTPPANARRKLQINYLPSFVGHQLYLVSDNDNWVHDSPCGEQNLAPRRPLSISLIPYWGSLLVLLMSLLCIQCHSVDMQYSGLLVLRLCGCRLLTDWLTDWLEARSILPPPPPRHLLRPCKSLHGNAAAEPRSVTLPLLPRTTSGSRGVVRVMGNKWESILKVIPRGSYVCVPQGLCLFYAGGKRHLCFVECGSHDGIFLKAWTTHHLSVRWTVKQSGSPLLVIQHCIGCENV